MPVLIVIVVTFALCFLVDKGFDKVFRRSPQHKSGKSVRLTKKYMLAGLLLLFFAALLAANGISAEGQKAVQLFILSACLAVMGLGFVIYYISFGVYYDKESFLFSSFGHKSKTYRFGQITEQQLLQTRAGICIELFFDDGRDTDLYANMEGVYDFMDAAFYGWCRERGVEPKDCPWYDPENSCWFPPHDPDAAEKAQNTVSYDLHREEASGDGFTVEPMDKE